MKLLGIIRNIGEARQWMTQTGPVTIYPVTFEAEGNTFIGDLYASRDYITSRGIVPGAVGYFDLKFKPKDVKNKDGVVMFQRQDVRFGDFRLANQNLTGAQAPANPPEPSAEEVAAAMAEAEQAREQAQEVNLDPSKVTF